MMWGDYERAKIYPGVPLALCTLGIMLFLDWYGNDRTGYGAMVEIFIAVCSFLFGLLCLWAGPPDALNRSKKDSE